MSALMKGTTSARRGVRARGTGDNERSDKGRGSTTAMRPRSDLGEGEDDGGGFRSRRRARMGEARAGPLVEMARDGRGMWRRLEAMGSGGGAVALGRRMKTMDGRRRRGDIY